MGEISRALQDDADGLWALADFRVYDSDNRRVVRPGEPSRLALGACPGDRQFVAPRLRFGFLGTPYNKRETSKMEVSRLWLPVEAALFSNRRLATAQRQGAQSDQQQAGRLGYLVESGAAKSDDVLASGARRSQVGFPVVERIGVRDAM